MDTYEWWIKLVIEQMQIMWNIHNELYCILVLYQQNKMTYKIKFWLTIAATVSSTKWWYGGGGGGVGGISYKVGYT